MEPGAVFAQSVLVSFVTRDADGPHPLNADWKNPHGVRVARRSDGAFILRMKKVLISMVNTLFIGLETVSRSMEIGGVMATDASHQSAIAPLSEKYPRYKHCI